jgi:hypothetical protein
VRPPIRGLALLALVLTAGRAGVLAGPEVVERQSGNVGVGGCQVTVENPADSPTDVAVTVRAVTASGDVTAENTEAVRVAGNARETVTVGASNAGGDLDHYEVSATTA